MDSDVHGVWLLEGFPAGVAIQWAAEAVVTRTAAMGSRATGRSRGGLADDRHGRSLRRPKPWWLDGGLWSAVAAQAEVVVAGRMAALGIVARAEAAVVGRTDGLGSRRAGRSRGGRMDGMICSGVTGRSRGG